MEIINKALRNAPDSKTVSHIPFDINEIASKMIIDTNFLMTRQVRSKSRRLEQSMPSGFDNQGRRNSRGLSMRK